MTEKEMQHEIEVLRAEVEEYVALIKLQQRRMRAAVDFWQKETGNKYGPDLGTLLEWLMERKGKNENH